MKALDTTLVGFGTRNTLSNATSTDARHRRGAAVDLRRAEAVERQAAGVVRHLPDRAAGPHHAAGRAAQRDGRAARAARRAASTSAATTTRSTSAPAASSPRQRARRSGRGAAGGAGGRPGTPGRSAAAAEHRLRHRRARRQRRRQRHRADDGAGAGVRRERPRVRRDAGVHLLGGRGAGADRIGGARAAHRRREGAGRGDDSTNDIVGNSRGGTGIVDAGERPRLCGRARGFAGAGAGALHRRGGGDLRAVAPRPADGARGSLRPRQRSGVVHPAGLSRRWSSARPTRTSTGSTRRATRSTASTSPTWRRTRGSTPRRWRRWRWRRRRRSVTTERGAARDRPRSVRLRRRPALDRVARRGRLSHLLARHVAPRLAARADGRATSPSSCCPACRSTTGCSGSRRSAPAATRAWSAPTCRRSGPGAPIELVK